VLEASTGNRDQLIVEALVSYADSCVLPNLTPSCPYYRLATDGAHCDEECRVLIEQRGGAIRPIASMMVGGLIMEGRAIPRSIVAGVDVFDARKDFLEERGKLPSEQCAGTLLLGLEAALGIAAIGIGPARYDRILTIWGEIERRIVDPSRIVQASLLPTVVLKTYTRLVLGLAARDGELPHGLPEDLLAVVADPTTTLWLSVLDDVVANASSVPDFSRYAMRHPYGKFPQALSGKPSIRGPRLAHEEHRTLEPSSPLTTAMSGYFLNRVEEWYSRLLDEDLMQFLEEIPPSSDVLMALASTPSVRANRDELGLWLWERFTTADLDNWALSSLIQEWSSASGAGPSDISRRVLSERVIDPDEVARRYLSRRAGYAGRRFTRAGLDPNHFTQAATEHLQAGRYVNASGIFAGIAELRPADGDVWNNLGFCQLPIDLHLALGSLQRAALFGQTDHVVNVANRVLALHLLDRNAEALDIAQHEIKTHSDAEEPSPLAFLWSHARGCKLELIEDQDPFEYLKLLSERIANGCCVNGDVS
jgi:hypothetical protein